jgi:uncharacterized membrane protein
MTGLNKISLSNIYYFFLICLTLFFVFSFPPFQKPDEPLHFERTFALAMGQITCKFDVKHTRGYFTFPKSVSTFPDAMMSGSIIMKPEGKFPIALLRAHYPIDKSQTTDLLYNCRLPFTGYIPLSLGIVLAMPFNNLLISFYAARLMAALFFVIAVYISLRIVTPRYRLIVMLSSIFPMVLQQVTAVSYDSVSIAMGFVLFSLFTRQIEMKKVMLSELLVTYGILLVFLFTKPGYYLFALLLAVPVRLVRMPMGKKIILSLILFAGITWCVWYSLTLRI